MKDILKYFLLFGIVMIGICKSLTAQNDISNWHYIGTVEKKYTFDMRSLGTPETASPVQDNSLAEAHLQKVAKPELMQVAMNNHPRMNIDVIDITWTRDATVFFPTRSYLLQGNIVSSDIIANSDSSNPTSSVIPNSLENAIKNAVAETFDDIRKGSVVMIEEIDARASYFPRRTRNSLKSIAEGIIHDEGFRIVERSESDMQKIRSEQERQLGWEYDERTAVSVGKFVGASHVLFINIDGDTQSGFVSMRLINVTTLMLEGRGNSRY